MVFPTKHVPCSAAEDGRYNVRDGGHNHGSLALTHLSLRSSVTSLSFDLFQHPAEDEKVTHAWGGSMAPADAVLGAPLHPSHECWAF